jgi:hypothetical protein
MKAQAGNSKGCERAACQRQAKWFIGRVAVLLRGTIKNGWWQETLKKGFIGAGLAAPP